MGGKGHGGIHEVTATDAPNPVFLDPERLKKALSLIVKPGIYLDQLANIFEVDKNEIWNHRRQNEAFNRLFFFPLIEGLFKLAHGYQVTEKVVYYNAKHNKETGEYEPASAKARIKETVKYIEPNYQAISFLLKNLAPLEFEDKLKIQGNTHVTHEVNGIRIELENLDTKKRAVAKLLKEAGYFDDEILVTHGGNGGNGGNGQPIASSDSGPNPPTN